MSQYERERQEHIARNKERMMALQLPSLANEVGPQKEARPAKPKGITAKRQKPKASSSLCQLRKPHGGGRGVGLGVIFANERPASPW